MVVLSGSFPVTHAYLFMARFSSTKCASGDIILSLTIPESRYLSDGKVGLGLLLTMTAVTTMMTTVMTMVVTTVRTTVRTVVMKIISSRLHTQIWSDTAVSQHL
jgi:hypothetical protein